MKNVQKIKGFQSQITKLEAESEVLKQEIKIKQDELRKKTQAINLLRSEIRKLQVSGKLKVSEHAIVRYLERVRGIDIQKIEQLIANDKVQEMVDKFTSGTFPAGDFSVVVKDNTVITIHN